MKEYHGLSVITAEDSIVQTKELIRMEASGKQIGLYTRFDKLNIAMLKYFRFGHFTFIAGRSGSGKSLLLNMIRNDFINGLIKLGNKSHIKPDLGEIKIVNNDGTFYYPKSRITELTNGDFVIKPLNHKCVFKVVLLHFGFEMAPTDENIRTTGTILGKSYAYILSAEHNKGTNDYNKLTNAEMEEIEYILDSMGERKEYYVPISGNIAEMLATVDYIQSVNPDAKLIVTLDHALLTREQDESGVERLMANLGHFAINVKQLYGAMVIFLHQLNNEIEQAERIRNKHMHYPGKIDIYFGNHLWNASDNVIATHVPKLLRIERYGPEELITDNLMHVAVLKSRFGEIGNIWLNEEFKKGRIHETTIKELKNPPNFNPHKRGAIKLK